MWKLSTQIFGSSMFTYKELSAEARDPDINRVKMAVKRLCIISATIINKNDQNNKKENHRPIWYSSNFWLWEVESAQNINDNCKFLSLIELKEYINKKLGDPTDGI